MNIDKKYICGGAIASLALVFTKLYIDRRQSSKEKTEEQVFRKQQIENEKELEELRQLQELLTRKSAEFQVEYMENSQYLDKGCLINFFNETMDLFNSQEISKLFSQNREGRRNVFKQISENYETYFKFVFTLDENIKYIIERTQKDFAVFLNISYQLITESVAYHMEYGNEGIPFRQQLLRMMSEIRQSLINYMPLFKKPLDQEYMENIIDYECKLLRDQQNLILDLIKKIGISNDEQEQSIPVFLSCYLEDSIFFKFGIQVEQMTIANGEFSESLRQKYELLKEMQENLTSKMLQFCDKEVFQAQ